MVAASPTATNVPFPKVTLERSCNVPERRRVHCRPSSERKTVPWAPTATKMPEPQVTLFRLGAALGLHRVQFTPSVELKTVPDSFTAASRPFPIQRLRRGVRVPVAGSAHWIPSTERAVAASLSIAGAPTALRPLNARQVKLVANIRFIFFIG